MTDGKELLSAIEESEHKGEYLSVPVFNKDYLTFDFSKFDVVILLGQDNDVDPRTALRLFEIAQLNQLPLLLISEEKENVQIRPVDSEIDEAVKFEQSLVGTFFELIFYPPYRWSDWADRVISCAEVIYDVSIGAPAIFLLSVQDVPEKASI